ncbi:hypothetical protein [Zooshikella harenae]|uniref:Uncharacterized protein n=1 Tax=Zooshikella harenae TaxID=2827238 RepID=A0ABS5ZIT9_9GAMM|nr:hypothetical protein [Zooshikella harenae]MBU2713176.1 hypothetical protein [Zooshikella harenae]
MKPENYVKNFRDVGESLFRIYGDELFPKGVLYRGGRLNSVFDHNEIFNVPTILNLRIGSDDKLFNCNYLHVPAEDKIENYDTSNGKIRKWVNKVISTICQDDIELPIFISLLKG